MLKSLILALSLVTLGLTLPVGYSLISNKKSNVIGQLSAPKEDQLLQFNVPKDKPLVDSSKEFVIGNRKTINLEAGNTLLVKSVISDDSVAQIQIKALKMSALLPKDAVIYLVLETPGGSISAGADLIDQLKALPQKVHTITLFAASMGFQIAQQMERRYIVNQGTLMSHRASGGIEGQFDGEVETRLAAAKRQIQYLDYIASKRMGMTMEAYKKLVKDEYWVLGFDAVQEKAADEVVNITCGESMQGTHVDEVKTIFGKVKVEFSDCPLVKAPLSIDFGKMPFGNLHKVKEAFDMLLYNKKSYVSKYILTNKNQEIFGK